MKQFFLNSFGYQVKVIAIFLLLNVKVVAQSSNASYNLNSIPINGVRNSAFGQNALSNNSDGVDNVAMGYYALAGNSLGNRNTAIGRSSLSSNLFGSSNTAVGYLALWTNIFGSSNTALGHSADVGVDGLTNATSIGYGAIVNNSNSIQLGNSAVTTIYGGVGINSKFITGGLQVTGGSIAAGKVLTSDAFGNATWQTLPASGNNWSLTGNAGTIDGTNFIGTTDNVPFNIRVNNLKAGRLDPIRFNTFYGITAGNNNSTGTSNTAIGYNSLYTNSSTSGLTAIGANALYSNTSGTNNTATGYNALYSNDIGSYNTANGYEALYTNSGDNNTATGYNALYSNRVGSNNTALGGNTLFSITDGLSNTAVGYGALYSSTGPFSSANTAIGVLSLYYHTDGDRNTAVGFGSLQLNYSGTGNTGLGYDALYQYPGDFNTGVGYSVTMNGNYANSTVIGNSTLGTASNQVRIGNSNVTSIGGYANWTNISDGRFKKNVKENVPGLDFIRQLRPVTYNLDIVGINEFLHPYHPKDTNTHRSLVSFYDESGSIWEKESILQTGFIAQEVEAVAKKMGYNFSGVDPAKNNKDLYGLRYSEFVVPLVKAVQELCAQNDSLKSDNAKLLSQLNEFEKRLTAIEFLLKQQGGKEIPLQYEIINDAGTLEQNVPNPFNSNTVIRYNVPLKSSSAEIIISNLYGVTLKTIPISIKGTGQVILTPGTLSSGTYIYSLIIDGRKIDNKQMVLTK